ncbi:hypothetical protein HCN44_001780 [Aphidius gifuensis]|uniref:Endoplasmic reticulum junction formation protein lunapark n=1 Tax=Aphidius gifuensis TaxID=684658 RepID=A0A834XUR8_APHGI|nr:hypothetical protein HCN44_001780 [Aphidius gifuensis]
MGVIFSRFRKKKTTIEILEDLDTQIKKIEQYGTTTEQRHKKIVGTLLIYSVLLYIVTAVVFYFYFFPASLYDQLFYITPLLIFPLLIIITKKMVSWYYKRKISKNHDKLITMEQEKKKILEEVTEKETYKKAKEILLKFAPDQLRMTPPVGKITSPTDTPKRPVDTPRASITSPIGSVVPQSGRGVGQNALSPMSAGGNELRRRAFNFASPGGVTPSIGTPKFGARPLAIGFTSQYNTPAGPMSNIKSPVASLMSPRSPLPRPILSQQRSYLDRLVEYLVGDGPSNRYALICQQCDSHNGMALKEEFEFFARKQKPSAPKLDNDVTSPIAFALNSKKLTESSNSSGSGMIYSSFNEINYSDIEVVEKPDTSDNDTPEEHIPENKTTESEQEVENLSDDKILTTTQVATESAHNEEMEIDESPRK